MNITFVSQYFYPEQFSNNSIAKELIKRGHEVDVVCAVPNYGYNDFFPGYSNSKKREEIWAGVKIWRARTVARKHSNLRLALNYLVYPFTGTFTALRKIRKRPTVVFVSLLSPITQAIVGIVLKRYFRVPLVYWLQDLWPESLLLTMKIKNKFLIKVSHVFCDYIYGQADLILVQSEAFAPQLIKSGVQKEKIVFFPNTAPDSYRTFSEINCNDVHSLIPDDERFKVMFAGNIGESQDFDTIVEAADLLRNEPIVWLIVGSGRDEQRARELVSERNLEASILFLGRHPEEKMPEFFACADAMIVSLKREEIFALTVPYKTQCYLACGKPIVGSLEGEGAKVIKQSGAGMVAPPENPVEFARIVKEMSQQSSDQITTRQMNARSYFEKNYSANVVYDRLEHCLRSVAD